MAQNPFSDPSYGADLAPPSEQSANPFADPNFGSPPKRRTLASIANDTVIEVANAAAGGVSSAANFVKPGNTVSGWIDKNIVKAGEANQSDVVKAEKQRFQQDVANADGVMGELGAVGRYVVDNPVLSAAQAVGSFVGPGAAVKGGRTLASIAGLNAARGGLAGGAAAGAAMAGGDAAGTAYDLATKGGATEDQAVAAGRQASVIPAVIGGVGGVVGAERLVAGAKGFAGNAVSRAVKTAAVEGAQEGIEEGVTQYEGQRAAMRYDKTIDPMKGVAAAAGMGAALGGATGSGVSLLTGGHHAGNGAPVQRAQIDPNRLNPENVATYSQYIESGLKPEKQQQYRQMLTMAQDAAVPEQARAAAARDLHAAFAPEALIQADGAGSAAASQEPAQPAAPAIDPNAGPLSKAASMAGDLGLAPVPAPPTAQDQRAQLDATIARLPEAQQREARLNLADLDNQSLPAGVRSMRNARLQELVGGAPAAPVELTPADMEPGRVLQNFDARAPGLPQLADYAPLIDEMVVPERRAEFQSLLTTATDPARPVAERDAAAETLHRTFSPEQTESAGGARPVPDTRLTLQDPAPTRYDNSLDFTAPTAQAPAPDAAAERINQLALDADLTPGEPMQLNKAHALRRAAAAEGITMSVIPHPSGRGYAEGKTVNVSRAETMAEANATRQQLQTPFPVSKGFTVGKVLKSKEFVADRDTVGRGFMEQLYGVLDKQGMDGKQKAELEDALGQLYLSSLPDLSWAKHGIHRKGTPGYSQDARRAFAQNVFHGASYLAKLRYSDQLQDQLSDMEKHVSARDNAPGFDSVRARQVVDEMQKRHEAAMNPKSNSLSTALTSLGFIYHLGLSPASAMVNLTQTALVAYPVMGAKWGYGKASAALMKASQEAVRGKNDITTALNADEKAAFEEADRALQARRSALVEQFAMAAMAGDEEGKVDAREDIAKFNEKNPNRRIQPMQLAQSVNMRQKRIREAHEGVYLPGKRRDALEAGRFAVPE